MTEETRRIRTVRIDVPLRTTHAYLFVNGDQEAWHPWWRDLYEFLLRLTPGALDWHHEPVQDLHHARAPLTEQDRVALVRFLRTAPAAQVAEHRTLRRAVELAPEQTTTLEVVYFSDGVPGKMER